MDKQGQTKTTFSHQWVRLQRAVNRAIQPSERIADENQRLLSGWLNILLFFLIPLTLVGAVSVPSSIAQESSVPALLFVISLTLVFVYVFNQRGLYRLAVVLLLNTLSALPYFAWISKNSFEATGFITSFLWVLLPILLASVFLEFRAAVLTVLLHLAGLASLPLIFPELPSSTVGLILGILFPLSALLLVANLLYQRNARKILDQAQQILITEGKLQQLLHSNTAVVYSAKASGDYPATFISSNIAEQSGYYAEQFLSTPGFWKEHIHPDDLRSVQSGFSSLIKNGEHVHEYRFRHRDGSYHWMRDVQKLVKDANNMPLEIVGTWIDINEQVELENKLKIRGENFRSIVDTNALGILIVDEEDKVQFANQSARQLLYSGNGVKEKVLGRAFKYLQAAERGVDISLPGSNGDGPRTARLISSETNWRSEPASLILAEDVTEKTQIEQALFETQEFNSKIVAASSLGIGVYDDSGHCVFANQALAKIVGTDHSELLLQNYKQLESWEKSGLLATAIKATKTGLEQRKDISTKTTFGKQVNLYCRIIPVSQQDEPHILLIADDVTDKLATKEALRDSEERYRSLAESAQDSIFVINRLGNIEYTNPAASALFDGSDHKDLAGRPLASLFPTKDSDRMLRAIRSVFDSGKTFSSAAKFSFPNQELWLDTTLVALPDADGEINSLMGVSRDITRRKEMEELSTRFGRVLENSLSEIYIFDAETLLFQQVNKAAMENLGYSRQELRAMTPLSIKPDFSSESFAKMIEPLRTGKLSNLRFETEHERKDGSRYPVEVNLQLTSGENSPAFVAIILDIRERKHAKNQIESANRALRTLSATSQAVLFADQETKLLEDVCRLIVETGDYHLAWVGYADQGEEKNVFPAAQNGYEEGYLESLDLSWGDNKRGHGPTGSAIRTGQTTITEDILNNPYFAEWSEDLKTKEYGSCISIPLTSGSESFGALTIFAKESKYFEPSEISLLEDLGRNLSFGINALRTKFDRERSNAFIETFNNIATHINVASSPGDVIKTLGDELLSLNITCIVFLDDKNNGSLKLEYTSVGGKLWALAEKLTGLKGSDYRIALEKFPDSEVLVGQKRSFYSDANVESLARFLPNLPGKVLQQTLRYIGIHDATRVINAPLIAHDQLIGIMTLWGDELRESDLPAVSVLADEVAFAYENAQLLSDLKNSNEELAQSYDRTLEGWSRALDMRDEETEGHSQRVTEMTVKLSMALGHSGEEIEHIRRGALLHDIGKIGVPDSILLKPGPLNDEELEIMREHPTRSFRLLSPISYLGPALDIPYAHHERWDGSGYPRGLKGEEIPLAARIFAVVDVWDALLSDRPYRKAWPEQKVREHLQNEIGKHFDPDIVKVFLSEVWPKA